MPWLTHASYPVLKIDMKRVSEGAYTYTLSQKPVSEKSDFMWPILVNTVSGKGDRDQFLLLGETIEFSSDSPVFFNRNNLGYYMCSYSVEAE